jgi:hypothetical protein
MCDDCALELNVSIQSRAEAVERFAVVLVATIALSACVKDRFGDSPAHYSGEHLYQVYCSPIRGYDFFTGEGDDETAHQRVLDMEHRVVAYVEFLQEAAPGTAALQR